MRRGGIAVEQRPPHQRSGDQVSEMLGVVQWGMPQRRVVERRHMRGQDHRRKDPQTPERAGEAPRPDQRSGEDPALARGQRPQCEQSRSAAQQQQRRDGQQRQVLDHVHGEQAVIEGVKPRFERDEDGPDAGDERGGPPPRPPLPGPTSPHYVQARDQHRLNAHPPVEPPVAGQQLQQRRVLHGRRSPATRRRVRRSARRSIVSRPIETISSPAPK